MPANQKEAYKTELHRALEKCQFVEETLKMCLLSAIEIVRIRVQPFFPFKLKPEDVSHLSLGTLVKAFAKIHDDKVLHDDLRSLTKERNDVAHRSLLFTIGELEDDAYILEQTAKMKAIADHATKLHERILGIRFELARALRKAQCARKSQAAGGASDYEKDKGP